MEARALFMEVATADNFVDFLTLPAYETDAVMGIDPALLDRVLLIDYDAVAASRKTDQCATGWRAIA